MNLQPRKVSTLADERRRAWMRGLSVDFRGIKISGDVPVDVSDPEPSIWRMELPDTSYMAPQAAFWWVSNEKR